MVLSKNEIVDRLHGEAPLLVGMSDVELQVQPNGVDLRIAKIFRHNERGTLGFHNRDRSLPALEEMKPDENGAITLGAGPYLVEFCEFMNLPNDLMAIGRPRSSLLRMGVTIDSAVWDAGFSGYSQSLLLVQSPFGVILKEHARVLQVVFIKLSEPTSSYTGEFKTPEPRR